MLLSLISYICFFSDGVNLDKAPDIIYTLNHEILHSGGKANEGSNRFPSL